jgi:hypothetical protein
MLVVKFCFYAFAESILSFSQFKEKPITNISSNSQPEKNKCSHMFGIWVGEEKGLNAPDSIEQCHRLCGLNIKSLFFTVLEVILRSAGFSF